MIHFCIRFHNEARILSVGLLLIITSVVTLILVRIPDNSAPAVRSMNAAFRYLYHSDRDYISKFSPRGDMCRFSHDDHALMRPIYERLEADIRKYAKLNDEKLTKYVSNCKATPGTCTALSIRDGKLFVHQLGAGIETRHAELLRLIDRVVHKFFPLPDVDFMVDTQDGGPDTNELPRFMLCGYIQAPQGIMVPDFSFFDYPVTQCPGETSHKFSHFMQNTTMRMSEMTADPAFFMNSKKNELFWRGARLNNPTRINQLESVVNTLNTSKVPPEVYNIKPMEWLENTLHGENKADGCVSMNDHCKSRFLLHLQGNTYSSRLKYLLLCGSVVFMPQQEYEEWWYPAIPSNDSVTRDNEIIVHVKSDVSDFHQKLGEFFSSTEASKRTVETGLRSISFATRVFSEQSVDCFWASVLIAGSKAWGPILKTSGRAIEKVLADPLTGFSDL